MATGRSVQFYGITNAVDAYDNQEVVPWALFQGAQLLLKYDGSDPDEGKQLLQGFLNKIETGFGGNGHTTYTLCVYENLPEGQKISSKTPFSGSFNFQLVNRMEGVAGYNERQAQTIGAIIKQQLDERFGEAGQPDEEIPEEDHGPWDAVLKVLDHPAVKEKIAGYALNLLDRFIGPTASPVGSIGTAAVKTETVNPLTQSETEKLNEAIETLWRADPLIGTHLQKLAGLVYTDKAKFNSLISMIDFL